MSAQVGIVEIHGKQYRTVAFRIAEFREAHPDWSIQTHLVSADDSCVVMRAEIWGDRGSTGAATELLATGYAEESRGASQINRTSALENCETSAVGRALAFLGLAGTEIASADEVANAIAQQSEKQMWAANRAFMDAFEENYPSIKAIRGFLAEDNFDAAKEAINEISDEDRNALNRAWTKGGPFNPRETKQIKWWNNDFDLKRNGK